MYRDQNSPGGVVETETGVAGGWDCGPGDDVTVAVDVGRKGRIIVKNNSMYITYVRTLTDHTPDIQLRIRESMH